MDDAVSRIRSSEGYPSTRIHGVTPKEETTTMAEKTLTVGQQARAIVRREAMLTKTLTGIRTDVEKLLALVATDGNGNGNGAARKTRTPRDPSKPSARSLRIAARKERAAAKAAAAETPTKTRTVKAKRATGKPAVSKRRKTAVKS